MLAREAADITLQFHKDKILAVHKQIRAAAENGHASVILDEYLEWEVREQLKLQGYYVDLEYNPRRSKILWLHAMGPLVNE